jgi:chromate reductase, NAD(P)H dehydrogenase (quinone)
VAGTAAPYNLPSRGESAPDTAHPSEWIRRGLPCNSVSPRGLYRVYGVPRKRGAGALLLMRILAISGSLRAGSVNTALMRAATALGVEGVEISFYEALAEIPPFNPDHDEGDPPPAISALRARLRAVDGVVISSPEYAHGVPGVLKNALDWLVGSGELVGKPVALVNASPLATRAYASLAETLTVMSARVIPEASLTVPVPRAKVDAVGTITDPEILRALRVALVALVCAAQSHRTEDA